MQERERRLLAVLGDGRFHSGEELARVLGVTRAAVWKHLHALEEQGLEVHAVRGRGYRLPAPLELLDGERIRSRLSPAVQGRVAHLDVFDQIDSTNSHLLTRAKAGAPGGSVCLAERQSAGRGRRGRQWVSPFAANLYLSVLWRYPNGPALLSGLSLGVGVAVARALEGLGAAGVGLKWPNDLLWQGRKLGGILLEFGGESSGPCQVVTGIGLNVAMPADSAQTIDQPWTDLTQVLGAVPSRNQLAARVLEELLPVLESFESEAGGLVRDWERYDLTAGRVVTLRLPNRTITGTARGVDASGALLLEGQEGLQRFTAGEVSLRFES